MNWITPSSIKQPQRSDYPSTADFDLAYDVWASVQNAGYNFLHGDRGSPKQYMADMVQFALSRTQNNFQLKNAPMGWDWALAGVKAAAQCFEYLSQIAVNLGDPNTVSVMTAWETGKGALYGGHDPIPTSGGTSATGTSAAPPGILGGTGPQ